MLYKYNKYVNIPGAQDANASQAPVAPGIPGPFSCSVTSCTIHVTAAIFSDGRTCVFCVFHCCYVMYLVNRGQVVMGMTQYCSVWARDQMVHAQF